LDISVALTLCSPWPQAGLMNNKGLTDRAQKASLYGWFGGSLSTILLELYELAGGLDVW
jgi:hypothetical protein